MAIRKIDNSPLGATNWTAEVESKNLMKTGWFNLGFTNSDYDYTNGIPDILAGSSVEVAGSIYKFDTNETPTTTSSAAGWNYLYLTPSGATLTANIEATVPVWDDAKNGWYASTNRRAVMRLWRDRSNTSLFNVKTPMREKSSLEAVDAARSRDSYFFSSWEPTKTIAASGGWSAIAYNGDASGYPYHVAVTNSGSAGNRAARILSIRSSTSTWALVATPADNLWNSVAFGNNIFVAVASSGTGNRVMTAPNVGTPWTIRTSAADNNWKKVIFANGLFVAVAQTGTGNRVMTSPDGITWTARTTPADNQWNDVVYGNGLFVAVASTGVGNRVMTSPNGITWTIRSSAADLNWSSIAYGNGIFVAAGANTGIMTSSDGITWVFRATNPDLSDRVWQVYFSHGYFISLWFPTVMISKNGIIWSTPIVISTLIPSNTWVDLSGHPSGGLVAVDSSSRLSAYSENPAPWGLV